MSKSDTVPTMTPEQRIALADAFKKAEDRRLLEETGEFLRDAHKLGLLRVHPRSPVIEYIWGLREMLLEAAAELKEHREPDAKLKEQAAVGRAAIGVWTHPGLHDLRFKSTVSMRWKEGGEMREMHTLSRRNGRAILAAAKALGLEVDDEQA